MPNPGSARTAEDFVVLLRQARALSELTYWELEERAAAAGHELAPAVLVEALGQATLPGEDLVVALLRACGRSDSEIADWLSVHARLAGPDPLSYRPSAFADARLDDPSPPTPAAPSVFTEPGSTVFTEPGSTVFTEPGFTRGSHRADDYPSHGTDGFAGRPAAVDEQTAVNPAVGSRPRHTLRLPGRGTRRAAGSLPRRLALTAAALVSGIGSVAVIISAVQHGDGSGPPVYTTGVPPDAAAAAQPSETAAPAGATPSAVPSASRTAPPSTPAQNAVLRTGTATLQNGQSIDLDGGGSEPDVVAYGSGDSIRADPSSRHFAPGPTATRQACAAVTTYQKSLQDLTAGSGVCVRTDKGRFAHLTVTRTAPLAFSYVVWS